MKHPLICTVVLLIGSVSMIWGAPPLRDRRVYHGPILFTENQGDLHGVWHRVSESSRLPEKRQYIENVFCRVRDLNRPLETAVFGRHSLIYTWTMSEGDIWILTDEPSRTEGFFSKSYALWKAPCTFEKTILEPLFVSWATPVNQSGIGGPTGSVLKHPPLHYSLSIVNDEPCLWIAQGMTAAGWIRDLGSKRSPPAGKDIQRDWTGAEIQDVEGVPNHLQGWRKINVCRSRSSIGGFSILAAGNTAYLYQKGQIGRLQKERIVWCGAVEINEQLGSAASQGVHLLMRNLQKKKYCLFSWDGQTARPLDVQDKDRKNIEPFLPAKEVDEKITKALTMMMIQRDKDEKAVAEFRRRQEKERKKRLAEEAKKPKTMTLQERLQQNERGK